MVPSRLIFKKKKNWSHTWFLTTITLIRTTRDGIARSRTYNAQQVIENFKTGQFFSMTNVIDQEMHKSDVSPTSSPDEGATNLLKTQAHIIIL